jgi:hypothetical protein
VKTGYKLLEKQDDVVEGLEVVAEGFENSNRKVVLLKVRQAYIAYVEMVRYYAVGELVAAMKHQPELDPVSFVNQLSVNAKRESWVNVGGQLMPSSTFSNMLDKIRSGKLKSWDGVHACYLDAASTYNEQVLHHALASLMEIDGLKKRSFNEEKIEQLLAEHVQTTEKVYEDIVASREKDMTNPFRTMVFENKDEQEAVIGKLEDNSFIKQKDTERKELKRSIEMITKKMGVVI